MINVYSEIVSVLSKGLVLKHNTTLELKETSALFAPAVICLHNCLISLGVASGLSQSTLRQQKMAAKLTSACVENPVGLLQESMLLSSVNECADSSVVLELHTYIQYNYLT
jgi:hypothetical protein